MFEQMGIEKHHLLCSSIPGYGIPQGAGDLYDYIRNEMNNDDLFVVMMLSENYYKSPVCLNEMGAAWVKRSAYQSILLPGFRYSEIRGAVNPRDICFSLSDTDNRTHALNEFKNRVLSHLGLVDIDHDLWERFRGKFLAEVDTLASMPSPDTAIVSGTPKTFSMQQIPLLTSDEKIILDYILTQQIRTVKRSSVSLWLKVGEVSCVDIDNAFDLLSAQGVCAIDGENLVLEHEFFRELMDADKDIRKELNDCVAEHRRFAKSEFMKKWQAGKIDDKVKLLVAYIVDEQESSLGAYKSEKAQIKRIQEWEEKNTLDDTLSTNYSSCLNYLKYNSFVYDIGWAGGDSMYQYRLCLSLENFFFTVPFAYAEELQAVKEKYKFDLPF